LPNETKTSPKAINDTEADVAQGELEFVDSKGQTGKVTKHKHVRFFVIKKRNDRTGTSSSVSKS
jgi:hypothetical protein